MAELNARMPVDHHNGGEQMSTTIPTPLHAACTWLCAGFALAAGVCWAWSTMVEKRVSGEHGIGPGLDGYLVVLNADGKPIEFITSYRDQAWWNRAAALSAAIAAVFQAGSVLF